MALGIAERSKALLQSHARGFDTQKRKRIIRKRTWKRKDRATERPLRQNNLTSANPKDKNISYVMIIVENIF